MTELDNLIRSRNGLLGSLLNSTFSFAGRFWWLCGGLLEVSFDGIYDYMFFSFFFVFMMLLGTFLVFFWTMNQKGCKVTKGGLRYTKQFELCWWLQERLPRDTLENIFGRLTFREICKLQVLSKRWAPFLKLLILNNAPNCSYQVKITWEVWQVTCNQEKG